MAAAAIFAFHRIRFIIVGNSFQLPLNDLVNIMGQNIAGNFGIQHEYCMVSALNNLLGKFNSRNCNTGFPIKEISSRIG